ncbi:MAG: DJ-1/PfpI family protein [Bacilli bacterium]|nr:DJ-1/PfpI family protein [Bacilli bacterium]
MKGLILFADGFEDSEGITTRDILLRGKVDVISASITDTLDVITSHNLKIKTDILLKDAKLEDYSFIIIPGGLKGTNNIANSSLAINAIKYFHDNNKDIYAICAAPSILGKLGYLDNHDFTCFKGFEKDIKGHYTEAPATITSEHIITGKSMAYSVDFALTILKKLVDDATYNHVVSSIKSL